MKGMKIRKEGKVEGMGRIIWTISRGDPFYRDRSSCLVLGSSFEESLCSISFKKYERAVYPDISWGFDEAKAGSSP